MYFSYHANRPYCLNSLIAESESRCTGIYWLLSYRKDRNLSSWAPPRLEYAKLAAHAVLIRSGSDPCVFFVLPDYMLKLATYFTNVRERWMDKGVRLDSHRSIILYRKQMKYSLHPKTTLSCWWTQPLGSKFVPFFLLLPIAINSDVAKTGLEGQRTGVNLVFREVLGDLFF